MNLDNLIGKHFHKVIVDDLEQKEERVNRQMDLYRYALDVLYGSSNYIAEEITSTPLTRKEAINALIDASVINGELISEIDELNKEITRLRKNLETVVKDANEDKIRHEGFVAGLTHGFKIESGDI